jgi:hypothetical protein
VEVSPLTLTKSLKLHNRLPSKHERSAQFLGLARYYRKFVKHFGIIARPLLNLLKKNTPFVWISDINMAFQLLKQSMVEGLVPKLHDFSKIFVIDTDMSDTGVGDVLRLEGHPIAYMSKPSRKKGLSTYEKECLW